MRRFLQPKRSPSSGRTAGGHPLSGLPARRDGWPGHTGAIQPAPRPYGRGYDGQVADRERRRRVLAHRGTDGSEAGRLLGRRALIAGGDSTWSGAVAAAFARGGADVAFSETLRAAPSIHQPFAGDHQTSPSGCQAGRKWVPLAGNLRTEDTCRKLVADSVAALGGLEILVIDASRPRDLARPGSDFDIAHMSTEQFDAAFRSNIYAMFWLTKAALPHLGPGSSIINTGPPSGAKAKDIELDYSATKGAIMVFTRSLASQLAGRGIRVNAVAPEPLWAPRSVTGEPPSARRRGRQEELISTYLWLASNESSYANGQLYGAVDAGGTPL